VQRAQPLAADAVVDGTAAHTLIEELPSRDDAVLAIGQTGDRPIRPMRV